MNKKYLKVESFYNSNSQGYAENSAVILREQVGYFLSSIPDNGRILDAGCGPGHDTEFFSRKGFDTTGIDFSVEMIEFCRKHRKGGVFRKMNMLDMGRNFPRNYFDGIWMSSSITHLEDRDIIKVLKQAKNILLENETLAIIIKRKFNNKLQPREILFRQFYKKEIISLLKLSGFSKIKLTDFEALNKKWLFVLANKA